MNQYEKRFQDEKGRIRKTFTKTKKLRPILISKDTGKIEFRGKMKQRKRDYKFTGVTYHSEGKFGSTKEPILPVEKGFIVIDGIKVANISSDTPITKREFNWLTANLKGTTTPYGQIKFKQPSSRLEFLKMLSAFYGHKFGALLDAIEQLEAEESPEFEAGMLPAIFKPDKIYYRRKPGNYFLENFWTFDTEDDSHGNVKLINFYDGKDHYHFQGNEPLQLKYDVWKFLKTHVSRETSALFATNLQYDMNNMFHIVYANWKLAFSGSSLIFCEFPFNEDRNSNKKRNLYFYESMSQLHMMSVEKKGKAIGLPKMDVGDNRVNLEYCQRDCEIDHKALSVMFDWDKKHNVEFGITIGSKALKHFNSFHLQRSLKVHNFTEFKPAYRGGRVEIFKLGESRHVNCYDINSLYPYVMRNFSFPNPAFAIRSNKIVDLGIYFVRVKIKPVKIPLLGIVQQGKYIFPTGSFKGMFTGYELRKAHEAGQIEKLTVVDGFKFNNLGKIFKSYVDELYNLRLLYESDPLLNYYIKILMNSLYGKFAQGRRIKRYNPETKLFEDYDDKYPDHTNYIWSIFVTSYARCELFKYLDFYQDHVIYCDTDSVHLTGAEIETGKKLGMMKHEGFFERGIYLQPKVYSLFTGDTVKTKAKGVPKKYHSDYIRSKQVTFKRPVKISEFLRNQFHLSQNPDLERDLVLNAWIDFEKRLSQDYEKRIVYDQFGHTKPIHLNY